MTRTRFNASTLLGIVLLLCSVDGMAAQAAAPQAAPPAAPVRRLPPPALLDLATASRMIAGAQAAAAALHLHIAVCVVDGRGDMVAFARMDGADIAPTTTAIGKAHAVLVFGVSTGQITDAMAAGKPVPAMVKAPIPNQDNLTFYRGGLPIMKDGRMVGAIGVGGSDSEKNDEAIAQVGIDAARAR